MDLTEIQRLLRDGRYEVSLHAQQERLEEDLEHLTQLELSAILGETKRPYFSNAYVEKKMKDLENGSSIESPQDPSISFRS